MQLNGSLCRWVVYLFLGINDFSDRGSVVRIWIKTEPLKQWEVAREFRRRLQKTF